MAQYAIAFDLDTVAMRTDGITDAQRTAIYQTEIPNTLAAAGFTIHAQGSVYHTEDSDSLVPIVNLQSILASQAPNFVRYASTVHLFRMEEWSDVTASLKGTLAVPVA